MSKLFLGLALLVTPALALAGGIPLIDGTGAAKGTASLRLTTGLVQIKIKGLAPLPAAVAGPAGAFTATAYKAYLTSSADPGVEVFLTDIYPNGKQRAARRIALGGDVSHLGFDHIAVTAYSSNAQQSADVLTASFAP